MFENVVRFPNTYYVFEKNTVTPKYKSVPQKHKVSTKKNKRFPQKHKVNTKKKKNVPEKHKVNTKKKKNVPRKNKTDTKIQTHYSKTQSRYPQKTYTFMSPRGLRKPPRLALLLLRSMCSLLYMSLKFFGRLVLR